MGGISFFFELKKGKLLLIHLKLLKYALQVD